MAQFAPFKPTTLLIVESEALVRIELAERLEIGGFIVHAARDAEEAITLLDAHADIQVMITDIRMSGSMDGIRLAHHVRNRWPPVKIIVTSGVWETALADLPLGSIFLPKPSTPDRLKAALAHLTVEKPSSFWLSR